MPNRIRRNDLELYADITNPDGPAMTWGIFSIGYVVPISAFLRITNYCVCRWMKLGNKPKAEELFSKSYQPYVKEPFKVWTETQSGVGAVNFITGAGGFLQTLLFGYGGLRVHPYHLQFENTFLPPGTDALSLIGLDYLGASFDVRLTADQVTYTCHQKPSSELEVQFASGQKKPFICDGNPLIKSYRHSYS